MGSQAGDLIHLVDNILEIEEVAYDSSTSGGRTIPRLIYKPSEKDIG